MTTLDQLLTSDNEVGITISFSGLYVEVNKESVTFYDPAKDRESGEAIIACFDRHNFDDIIAACEVIPSGE